MLRSIHGLFVVCLLVSLPFLLIAQPLHAQIEHEPALRITKIEVENFPDVKVYLRGDNLRTDLSALPVTLSENGQEVEISSNEIEEIGTQTALLLDASGSVLDPGVTGEPRYKEVVRVTRRLIELEGLLTPADWLAAYASGTSGNIKTIQDWTPSHQAVANNLDNYEPPKDVELETPLYDLVYFALDRFDRSDAPDNATKRIVLFSDGVAGSSDLKLDDAVNRAVKENIPIHTVLLGEGTEQNKSEMRRIAKLTGGQAYQITSVNALDGLWRSLIEGRSQRVLSYRSQLVQPTELLASVTLLDGVSIKAAVRVPTTGVQPVQVQIGQPTNGFLITKEAPKHDTPLSELEPKILNIQVNFFWPGGRPRKLTRVEYVVNNHTEVPSEQPFDQIAFPIDRLDEGDYTIRVIAIDELGLKAESQPITFRVDVSRPTPPTPQSMQVQILEPTNNLRIIKEAPSHDMPLSELEPKTLDIQVDFLWPDGQAQKLTRVEYVINNHTQVRSEEPFEQITFPIDSLGSGNHTIRVIAIDELGVKSQSQPVTFRVDVNRQSLATPTPSTGSLGIRDVLPWISMLMLLIVLVLAVLAFRKLTLLKVEKEDETFTITVTTEPFRFNSHQAKTRAKATSSASQVITDPFKIDSGDIKAKLVVEERGRAFSLPNIIYIRDPSTKIGRSPEWVNLVIDDPHVSRYHCRIIEEVGGALRLFDEQSGSGTYVNFESVDLKNGYLLQSGDLINIGPVQLSFHYNSNYDHTNRKAYRGLKKDNSEPLQPMA